MKQLIISILMIGIFVFLSIKQNFGIFLPGIMFMFYRKFGSKVFLGLSIAISILLFTVLKNDNPFSFFSALGIVLSFETLKRLKFKLESNVILTVLLSTAIGAVSLILFIKNQNISITQWMDMEIQAAISASQGKITEALKMEPSELSHFVPAFVIISNIFALWFGLVMARPLSIAFGEKKFAIDYQYNSFRNPLWMIFLTILAILFMAIDFQIPYQKEVAASLLYIFAVAYLFQGLSIVSFVNQYFRVSSLWQMLSYFFIIFGQMFILIIILGFLDFWIDIRSRILNRKKKTSEVSR